MKFFHEHVRDSIRMIAHYNNDKRLGNFALKQLETLTKESAKICSLNYEEEMGKALKEGRPSPDYWKVM